MTEYRIRWAASSNISFHGHSDWMPWDEEDGDIHEQLESGGTPCEGLEMALELSGFEWDIETR